MGEWTPAPKRVRGRLREIRVHFGTFDYAFYCVVGPYEDLTAYLDWRHDGDFTVLVPAPRGEFHHHERKAPVVWIPKAPRSPREYGTLAHEVLHVVRAMGDWCRIPLTIDTQELYCHALGHAMTTILTELRRKP